MKNNNLSSNWTLSCQGLSTFLVFPFILVCDSAGSACSLHQSPCNLIHAAYLSHSVFFHTLTNVHMLWPQKRLEKWKGLPKKPFRQNLRGRLESFNSNKAGRKACLLLVIPHLLDKASQGSSAALNWCTYSYLYRSSNWQPFKPSCLFAYPHSWQNWLFPEPFFKLCVTRYFHWACHY